MTHAGIFRAILLTALAGSVSGCLVSATRYEEAQSRLRVEQAGHRQTTRQLHETREKLRQAEAQTRERERELARKLEDNEKLLAQSQLDISVASKEREQAVGLVEQLRGELARVGDHLRSFSTQKGELAEALAKAKARVERLAEIERSVRFRALVVRDLSLALYEPLATGEFELAVVEGRVVLRVPAARVFASPGTDLHPEAPQLLAALAQVAKRHKQAHISISESGGAAGSQQLIVRLENVLDGLVEQGVDGARLTIKVAEQTGESVEAAEPAPSEQPEPVAVEPATVSFAISAEA